MILSDTCDIIVTGLEFSSLVKALRDTTSEKYL